MSDVICVVVTEWLEPTVDRVFPELTVNPAPPELKGPLALPAPLEPRVFRVLRGRMASQARTELPVDAALPERRVLKAQPALREPRALKDDPETANARASKFTAAAG